MALCALSNRFCHINDRIENCCNYESFSQSVVRDFFKIRAKSIRILNLVILMNS